MCIFNTKYFVPLNNSSKFYTPLRYMGPQNLEVCEETWAPALTPPPPDSATGELQVYIASHLQ